LPGFLPPVYAAGDLLVDGAALNDLPVDVLRDRLGSGCVVAVDLSPDVEPLNTAPFEHGLSGWQVLKTHLNPFGTPRPAPNAVDILARSTGLSQFGSGTRCSPETALTFCGTRPLLRLAH
jgi:predicted acylesterase/phospholipase RssA